MPDVERVSTEAADWFVRLLDRPVSADLRERFAQWLVQSPSHVQTYLALVRTWTDIDLVKSLPSAEDLLSEVTGAEAPGVAPVAQSMRRPARRPWLGQLVAVACTAIVMAAGWMAWIVMHERSRIETAVGEQRSLSLADGSLVQLNTDSELTFELSKRERAIQLLRGEAQFVVKKDASRPFIVTTSQAHIRAIGTVFNVRSLDRSTAVAVIHGHIEVVGRGQAEQIPGGAPPRLELRKGERATVASAGGIVREGGPPLARMALWPQRRLVFNDEPLSAVVAEFNRYESHSLRIADPAIANFRITGSFETYDLSSLLAYLEKYQGVVARGKAGEQVLLMANR